jgi:hypothetical protein
MFLQSPHHRGSPCLFLQSPHHRGSRSTTTTSMRPWATCTFSPLVIGEVAQRPQRLRPLGVHPSVPSSSGKSLNGSASAFVQNCATVLQFPHIREVAQERLRSPAMARLSGRMKKSASSTVPSSISVSDHVRVSRGVARKAGIAVGQVEPVPASRTPVFNEPFERSLRFSR